MAGSSCSSSALALLRRRLTIGAAVPPLPVAAVVLLLAAAAAAPAAAAPAWLFPPGTTKPPVIEGVQCPSNVVDVPNSAAFPPAPWAASATYRLTTAGAEYELPNAGGPLVVAAGVTVCVVGTRATLRARNDVAFFDLEGGALGLSGVTLRGNGTGPTGVRALNGAAPSKLGAAQASFEDLFVGVIAGVIGSSSRWTAAFRDARFVRNYGGAVRVAATDVTFDGQTVFEGNTRLGISGSICAGLFLLSGSSTVFRGPARFSGNRVPSAGIATALYVALGSSVRFLGDAVFEDNGFTEPSPDAGYIRGTILVDASISPYPRSRVSFEGGLARFARNTIGTARNAYGGGVLVVNASLVFASKVTEFVDQTAYGGSGVFAVDFADVTFARGDVRATGGAALAGTLLWADTNSTASFAPDTTIDVFNNSGRFGQLVSNLGSKVDVQSRWARFTNNVASTRAGAFACEAWSTLTFGPTTVVTIAGNKAGYGGAAFMLRGSLTTFEGPTCIKQNTVSPFGGGALHVNAGARVVFKDPPSSTSGGGFGCKLPHPLFCPAGQQGQVMGDNSAAGFGPTAAVYDSAIVCASNGLTRGEGSYVIEGPVCGAACVEGGGNCTCPAGQPFNAADCACKASKPLWPFPHPWLGGKAVASTATTTATATARAPVEKMATPAPGSADPVPLGKFVRVAPAGM